MKRRDKKKKIYLHVKNKKEDIEKTIKAFLH